MDFLQIDIKAIAKLLQILFKAVLSKAVEDSFQ
jgi:hypothetical protein